MSMKFVMTTKKSMGILTFFMQQKAYDMDSKFWELA